MVCGPMEGCCAELVLYVEVGEPIGSEYLEELFAVGRTSAGVKKMVGWSGSRGVYVVQVDPVCEKKAGYGGIATVEGPRKKLCLVGASEGGGVSFGI
jgi:hypothetical protein